MRPTRKIVGFSGTVQVASCYFGVKWLRCRRAGGDYNYAMNSEFQAELQRRREAVRRALSPPTDNHKGDVLVLFSAPVFFRNADVEHSYRQHSDFYYLTGFEEPEAALVLAADEPSFVLFLRPRQREKETWEGRRVGVEAAPDLLAVKAAHSIDELDDRLPDYLEDRQSVHFLFGENEKWDSRILSAINRVRSRRRKRVSSPTILQDARCVIHEMRLVKSPWEQTAMSEVCQLTALGHEAAMRNCRPGMSEWQLQNEVEAVFRAHGCRRVAYESIVGSGENATILHYRENTRVMEEGELVLIDAGAEKNYLAADITRTFPVSGRFSPIQARFYQFVLDAQLAAIEASQVGKTLEDVHQAALAVIVTALSGEGIIAADASQEQVHERAKRFFMHRTSHFLGMDVHDVVPVSSTERALQPGMVITVEPGLYFASDDETVSPELRGMGIRIEDDVLITARGPSVLTGGAPKTIAEIERACSAGLSATQSSSQHAVR